MGKLAMTNKRGRWAPMFHLHVKYSYNSCSSKNKELVFLGWLVYDGCKKKKKGCFFSGTGTEVCLSELSPGACHIIGIKPKSYLRNQQIWKHQPYTKGAATVLRLKITHLKAMSCLKSESWMEEIVAKQFYSGTSGVLYFLLSLLSNAGRHCGCFIM